MYKFVFVAFSVLLLFYTSSSGGNIWIRFRWSHNILNFNVIPCGYINSCHSEFIIFMLFVCCLFQWSGTMDNLKMDHYCFSLGYHKLCRQSLPHNLLFNAFCVRFICNSTRPTIPFSIYFCLYSQGFLGVHLPNWQIIQPSLSLSLFSRGNYYQINELYSYV